MAPTDTKTTAERDDLEALMSDATNKTTARAVTCELCWEDFDPEADGAEGEFFDCCPECAKKVRGEDVTGNE